jgi:hypothetical protein
MIRRNTLPAVTAALRTSLDAAAAAAAPAAYHPAPPAGAYLHSFTLKLNLSRFDRTSPCPPV